jgi:hypothetical protein
MLLLKFSMVSQKLPKNVVRPLLLREAAFAVATVKSIAAEGKPPPVPAVDPGAFIAGRCLLRIP